MIIFLAIFNATISCILISMIIRYMKKMSEAINLVNECKSILSELEDIENNGMCSAMVNEDIEMVHISEQNK